MPDAPVIASFDLGEQRVAGTAEAGVTVTAFADPPGSGPPVELGQVTADGNGDWEIAFGELNSESYAVYAVASDGDGDSGQSNAFRLLLDRNPAVIQGSGLADQITGSAASEILDTGGLFFGIEGTDTLIGGEGDDTYQSGFAFGGANQVGIPIVIEQPGEGTDLVIAGFDFILPANVENLRGDQGGLELTGNELDNLIEVDRFEGNSTVTGGSGDDLLRPSLTGPFSGRADTPDNVAAYSGNRSDYTVTQLVNGFVIADNRTGSPDGTDTVELFDFFRFADGQLAAAALIGDQGQPAIPVIDGFDGDSMELTGTAEPSSTLQLYANSEPFGSSITVPVSGRWTIELPELAFVDTGSNFTYTYDFVATATNANGMSAGSERLSITVDDDGDLERVQATDADIDHVLSGPIEEIQGGGGDDTLTATGSGTYDLFGGDGDDLLIGNSNENRLNGGTGNDTMIGGEEDDDYVVDSLGDVIVEEDDEGGDEISVSLVEFTLPEHFERLIGGSESQELTGNEDNNFVDGRSGDDLLRGLGGSDRLFGDSGDDTLIGGAGNDTLDDVNEFGGRDRDVAVFSGNRADYEVTESQFVAGTYLVKDMRSGSPDGTDTVVGFDSTTSRIEVFRFADGDVDLAQLVAGDTPTGFSPTAQDDYFLVTGTEPVIIDVLGNDSDPEGDPLSIQLIESFSANSGTIVDNGDGTVTFTPGSFFSLVLDYIVVDPDGHSARGILTIEKNLVPLARNDSAAVEDGEAVVIDVLANDFDSQLLSVTAVTQPTFGTAAINPDGTVTYTANAGVGGAATFTYTVDDGFGLSATATVTVDVDGPLILPPVATDDSASLDEDSGSVVIDLLANDAASTSGALSVASLGETANGTLLDNGDGTVTYTPDANFNGADTFTYTLSEAGGGSATATVTVTVNPVNDAPVALDDAASLDEDSSVAIDVLANDSDVDGDALTASLLAGPANGSVLGNGDGSFTYTPDPDFTGTDSFTYTISDGNGGTDTATVTVTINPVNDAPVANDDALFASIDTARTYAATVLLANDSDIDGDALTITSVQGALNGTVALDGTTVTFTPEAGFTGAASFTYTVSDGNGGSDTASVAVTVTEGNQPPVAPATQAATTLRGAAILVEVGASDPDGDVLTYGVSGAVNGTASIDEDGLVTYTPDAGFTGSETLVVTIDDGNGGSASQEIALTVSALPAANQFRLFASDGFAGSIGGSGAVIGTGGFQDIAVLDVAGTVSFDPSFNQGDDIVRLSGDADDWYVSKSGSSAIFTDGDTFVQLAVGPAGMAVVFDDGARTLRLDVGGGGAFLIGDQVFTATLARVDAAPDGTTLPGGADAQASARLFLAEDGGASAAGKVNVIGTGGAEIATLLSGTITLDPSFNKGGDVIRVDEAAEDFLASKSGSSALLVGSDTTLLVPVGLAGATLAFGDGSDTRELLLSIEPNGITIDEQFFGVDPMRLMAAV